MRKEAQATILGLDHVQLAAPAGCESLARKFYAEVLGLTELAKPPLLQSRGGCWFQCGTHQLHIGVDADFQPARKAHPTILVTELDSLRSAPTTARHSCAGRLVHS